MSHFCIFDIIPNMAIFWYCNIIIFEYYKTIMFWYYNITKYHCLFDFLNALRYKNSKTIMFWYYNIIILEYYKTVLSNFPYVAMRGGCIRGGANSPWSLYQRQSMLHRALWKVHYHRAWWWLWCSDIIALQSIIFLFDKTRTNLFDPH